MAKYNRLNKKQSARRRLTVVICDIFIAAALIMAAVAVYNIAMPMIAYKQNGEANDEIVSLAIHRQPARNEGVVTEETAENPTENENEETTLSTVQPQPRTVISADFELLESINTDIKAWLILDDTVINYPVLQSSDNEYYLNHMYNKRKNMSGSIFIDAANSPDFSDRHTVIHGHNMKNGSMFAQLLEYSDSAFFTEHPYFTLLTPDESYTLYVFSAYETNVTTGEAYMTAFINGASFKAYAEDLKSKSDFDSDIEIGENDRIVTLSTCIRTNGISDERFVVHTLIKSGENE